MSEAAASSDVTPLFQHVGNGMWYRIPALLYMEEPNIFLAFAEQRLTLKDESAKCLVMRRGVEVRGTLQWEKQVEVKNAKQKCRRTMNPCPLYDSKTKTVFLFFICVKNGWSEADQIRKCKNAARICYITSTDHGKSWSSCKNVTEEVLAKDLKNCATLAVGPGHGIQSRTGRLIVPAYFYYIHSRKPIEIISHSFIFYSDDHGKSWHRGSTIREETNECEVAEVACSNGPDFLYCSARTKNNFRVEATSSDLSMDFNISNCNDLCEPPFGCQGSVLSYQPSEKHRVSDQPDSSLSWLLYSHPTSNKKRVNLGIYLNKSPLGGWSQPWIINKGHSEYSDLAVCQGTHTFGCLFECGEEVCDKIVFRRFTEDELMENLPKASDSC